MFQSWTSDCGLVSIYNADWREAIKHVDHSQFYVIADPPYEITAGGGGIGKKREYLHKIEGFTDSGFDYSSLLPFRSWAVFCTLRQVPRIADFAETCGKRWMLVTWNKPDPTPLCNGNYLPDTEYIIHAWSNGELFGDCRDKNRYILRRCMKTKGGHPNEKPVDVMSKIVRNASPVGGVVCDLFMGSGTTGVAAIKNGRKFIGFEIEPHYYMKAKDRLSESLSSERFLSGGFCQARKSLLID